MRARNHKRQYFISILIILIVSALCFPIREELNYRVIALLLLLTVSVVAMLFDILPVLLAATLSALIWNYCFIPPVFTLDISSTEDLLMFLSYFFVALLNAVLTFKIRQVEKKARDKEEKEKTIALYNTLLNSLSHELRTPIATILGAVDTLSGQQERLSADHKDTLLDEIGKAGSRLDRQVENLLNISRLESGTLSPRPDWCDLNDLLHSIIRKLPDHNGHHIIFKTDERLPLFRIDAGFTEQMIGNLLHNAIRYTPEHTTIEISVADRSGTCAIIIADNGNGFPEDKISLVFDKFYRLPDSRTGGSGLGLSIVKGFAEAQGGTVSLGNNASGGATFTIELPAATSYLNNLKNE